MAVDDRTWGFSELYSRQIQEAIGVGILFSNINPPMIISDEPTVGYWNCPIHGVVDLKPCPICKPMMGGEIAGGDCFRGLIACFKCNNKVGYFFKIRTIDYVLCLKCFKIEGGNISWHVIPEKYYKTQSKMAELSHRRIERILSENTL